MLFDNLYVSNYDPDCFTYNFPPLDPKVPKLSAYFLNVSGSETIRFSLTTPKSQENSLNGCGWMILKLSEESNQLVQICDFQENSNVNVEFAFDQGHYLFLVVVVYLAQHVRISIIVPGISNGIGST